MIVLTPAVSGSHQTPSLTIDLETIQAIKRDPNIQNIDAMIAWYQTQTNLLYAMRLRHPSTSRRSLPRLRWLPRLHHLSP